MAARLVRRRPAYQDSPDSEATRRLAYHYYEEDLAKKNAARPGDPDAAAVGPVDSGPESR